MADYKKSVGVQGGLYALGEFPIAHAEAIEVSKDKRLDQKLNDLDDRVTGIGHTTQIVEDALEGLTGDTGSVKQYIDDSTSAYPIVDTIEDIPLVDETYYSLDPETYYVFGVIDSLPVYCNDPGDGKIHEFVFEFTPSETFTGITFGSTAPSWATPVQLPVGRVCQVSIMRGVGVMISA